MGGFSVVTQSAVRRLWHHQPHTPVNHNDLFRTMRPDALDVTQPLSSVVWCASHLGAGGWRLNVWHYAVTR